MINKEMILTLLATKMPSQMIKTEPFTILMSLASKKCLVKQGDIVCDLEYPQHYLIDLLAKKFVGSRKDCKTLKYCDIQVNIPKKSMFTVLKYVNFDEKNMSYIINF